MGFREGFATGTQAGGFGKFFEVLSGEIDKSQKRREEEDIRRRKEDLERKKEEFQLKGAIEKIRATGEEQRKTKREFPPGISKITGTDVATASALGELEEPPTRGQRALGIFQHLIPGAQPTERKIKRFGEAQEKFGEVSPELRQTFLGQFGLGAKAVSESAGSRQKAVKWLEDNGQLVTESNIKAVADRFGF